MTRIGAFDAKTHLSALLTKVADGEQFVITKHGKAVARLVPIEENFSNPVFRQEVSLKKESYISYGSSFLSSSSSSKGR